MPYSQGPYQRFSSLPVPPRPKLSEAREIDFTRKRYVIDPVTGGFSHMSETAQMVVILSFKVPLPEFNTLQSRNKYKQDLERVLEPLTSANPPRVEDLEVIVTSPTPGGMYKAVKFTDIGDHRRPITEVQIP
jgi:hypothetical protein